MQRTQVRGTKLVGAIVALAAMALAAAAWGQQSGPGGTGTTTPPIVGGAPFVEAWVDPCMGSDALGLVGCPDRPFLTLNAAIGAVSFAGAGPGTPGLVHANPGVYGPLAVGGNGEFFPVTMLDFVNVQGVGAKRCIIRGDQTQPRFGTFYPVNTGCTCGNRAPREVLVDYSFTFDPTYEEFIDGFTFQGGEVQVYFDQEGDLRGRISNCVFDMLDHTAVSEVGVPAPNFGVLMVSIFCPFVKGGYFNNQVNILNNSFIQGWSPIAGFEITGRPDSAAICDVNDPLCGFAFPDPDPTLRGVGSPSIQNNLIRYCETARTPLLGIDATDVTAISGMMIGPSNAFDPTLPGVAPGSIDVSGSFCSMVLGALPFPAVNPIPATGGTDPAFVGEMLSSFGGLGITLSRDWRILPDSILIDAGIAPTAGVLTAGNGTTYIEPALLPESSFDFDGEVYGNLRIVAGVPDIGFDEFEVMINAGGYGNDTRTYGGPCPPGCPGTPGINVRGLIFAGAGTFNLFRTWTPITLQGYGGAFVCPGGFWWAFSSQFGTLVPPAFNALGIVWIQTPTTLLPLIVFDNPVPNGSVALFTGYTPPCDPDTPHSFGLAVESASLFNIPGVCFYVNEQVIFTPTGGPGVLSNLQVSYDGSGGP